MPSQFHKRSSGCKIVTNRHLFFNQDCRVLHSYVLGRRKPSGTSDERGSRQNCCSWSNPALPTYTSWLPLSNLDHKVHILLSDDGVFSNLITIVLNMIDYRLFSDLTPMILNMKVWLQTPSFEGSVDVNISARKLRWYCSCSRQAEPLTRCACFEDSIFYAQDKQNHWQVLASRLKTGSWTAAQMSENHLSQNNDGVD